MANNVITGELVNGAMTVLNGALQFLNTGLGTTLTQVTLFSGAIYGLVAKIGAMKVIPAITNSFKIFGAIMKGGVAAGIAAAGKGATALTAVLSGSMPVILGVVAALALLAKGYKAIKDSQDYDLQLSKLQDIQSEYDSQSKRIQELEELGGQRTKAEEAELEVLKQQTAELEKQIGKQQEKADKALSKEIAQARMGVNTVELAPEYGGGAGVEYYDKVERQFDNLIEMAQLGRQNTTEYRKALNDFIGDWGKYADSLKEAASHGKELSDEEWALVLTVEKARGEVNYLNKTYGENVEAIDEAKSSLQEYADSYKSLDDRLAESTEALEKFKQATAVDYSAPLKGYQEQFKYLQEKLQSGTANFADIQAGVELFLPDGTLESLNYDLEAAAEQISVTFNDKLNTIFSASDPLAGFRQVLEQSGDGLKLGDKVVAQIVGDNGVIISSYEELAQALGTTPEVAQAIGGAIQQITPTFFYTTGEIDNLKEALQSLRDSGQTLDLSTIVATISQVTDTADPAKIQGFISVLQSIGAIDPNIEIGTGDIKQAISETQDLGKEVGDLPDNKEVQINTKITGDDLQNYRSLLNGIGGVKNQTVNTTIVLRDSHGNIIDFNTFRSLVAQGKLAKGSDYAAGGPTLVNDGVPVNGSAAELIVEDGNARIVNGGMPTVTNLKRGAKVYTAAETQAILKNSKGNGTGLFGSGIQAFGSGSTIGNLPGGGGTSPNYNPNASGTITPSSSDPETRKEEFDEWLKEKKHYLAMDIITEAEYYRDLETMNERYLKGQKDYLDEYWQHQEEIYQYQKRDLKDIIDLEEKLNNLAKAKTQKVLVYKDGMFQYIQNTEAIAKAQRAVSGYANGTTSSTAGVHMVGENGPELRVLGEGEGIIPANITKNLMRLGSMGSGSFNRLGNTEVNNFNIGKVLLEKVNDVDGLFNGLKNLAMQTATARA